MAEPAFDDQITPHEPYIHLAPVAQPTDKMAYREPSTAFAKDVRRGLSQLPKHIPSMYLYDSVGSALFEAICNLSEYKCTVGEKRLLTRYGSEIAKRLPLNVVVAELGGGSGEKASLLMRELAANRRNVPFHNIDISPTAIEMSRHLLQKYPNVVFAGHTSTFDQGLAEVAAIRPPGATMFVMFLGSSIGNFDQSQAQQLIKDIRSRLKPADFVLLGTDLIKDKDKLISAYDDPTGVTAAFNKNLLARINRELDANFDLSDFRHEARWDDRNLRIEMHLVSLRKQTVRIPGAGLTVAFNRGESIRTEYSHKYRTEDIVKMAAAAAFDLAGQWIDKESQFASNLLKAI